MARSEQWTCDECGHVGVYASAALAAFHFPRHSCAAVIGRRARAQRQLDRLASAGDEKPCTCKLVNHEHGDRLRYVVDGCRCHPCKVANREYEKARQRQKLYGRSNVVSAAAARVHLLHLMSQGMGWKRVARAAGLSPSTVYPILYGRNSPDPREVRPPRKQITKAVSEKLLAVQLDLADGSPIDGTGTRRRLQALVAIGWSQNKLAARIGFTPPNFGRMLHGAGVSVRTAKAVKQAYDELWDQRPPTDNHRDKIACARSISYARERGWVPPLAWDDDLIDDPSATAVTEIQEGPRTSRVHPEDVEWLMEEGLSQAGIAARLGVHQRSLQIALERADRRGLWLRLSELDERRRTAPRRVA